MRYYKVETGQYKGEISIGDMLEVTCNALLLSDAAISTTGGTALNVDPPGPGGTGAGTGGSSGRLLSRNFFSFRGSSSSGGDALALANPAAAAAPATSKLLKEDRGFTIRTASRVYVFQAESCSDAAGWVITLRRFITAKHIK